MQFTTILALAPLALAAPLETRAASSSNAFVVIASHENSPIHQLPYTIRDSGIFLGGSANTFCPSSSTDCSQYSNQSAFNTADHAPGTVGRMYLNAVVPGSQYAFVATNGALGYNHPHSSEIPAGADTAGFLYTAGPDGEGGNLTYTDSGATGFVACPVTSGDETEYQIFANVEGQDFSNCIEHNAVADAYNDAPAFSYN